jgi:hypothetical protein
VLGPSLSRSCTAVLYKLRTSSTICNACTWVFVRLFCNCWKQRATTLHRSFFRKGGRQNRGSRGIRPSVGRDRQRRISTKGTAGIVRQYTAHAFSKSSSVVTVPRGFTTPGAARLGGTEVAGSPQPVLFYDKLRAEELWASSMPMGCLPNYGRPRHLVRDGPTSCPPGRADYSFTTGSPEGRSGARSIAMEPSFRSPPYTEWSWAGTRSFQREINTSFFIGSRMERPLWPS